MRWLADENIPRPAIVWLRMRGEDVESVSEVSPNLDDEAVLKMARVRDRMVLSFDRDFGDLIFRHGAVPARAVIYLRLNPPDPAALDSLLAGLIEMGEGALDGRFTVISTTGMRQRPFPEMS
jgi:predicted nuclease of predicted toxin-antitoxin system